MKRPILAAEMDFLIDYAKNQFAYAFGLHLNSSDWKPFIKVGNPIFYRFLIDGIVQFTTKTAKNNNKYNQVIKLVDYKKIEPAIFVLFLLKIPDKDIATFIGKFLLYSNARIHCNCDAFKYWGAAFNLTHIQSIYGPPENRPPKIRDPKRENLICKHLWVVLETFEKQINFFANGLIPYYKRLFGLHSTTSVDRTIRKFNDKKMRKLVENASLSVSQSKNKTLIDEYIKLTEDKINDLIKLNKSITESPTANDSINKIVEEDIKDKIEETTLGKPDNQPEIKPDTKINNREEIKNWIDKRKNDLGKAINKDYDALMTKKMLNEKIKMKELLNEFFNLYNNLD